MTERKQHLDGKIVVFVVAVFALLIWLGNSSGESDVPEPENDGSRSAAWGACKDAVTEQLRNPDSADFSILSTDISEQSDGSWSIAGTVKASNDFGVETEISYSCVVEDGRASASLSQ